MIFKWFSSAEYERFGTELAGFVLGELKGSLDNRDAKFAARADKAFKAASLRVQEFKSRQPMNFFRKAKVANAFLWALKDGGCPDGYADELTEWLTRWL